MKVADTQHQIGVTPKRWLVLFTFSLVSFLNTFNWIEHSAIEKLTGDFYFKSYPDTITDVNWLSMIYLVVYIVSAVPAMLYLDRMGIRQNLILGALLTTIGSVIKCFSLNYELFSVVMTGQVFCALGGVFTLNIPSRLSALWFGSNQVALVTSIGVFASQLGMAFGFWLPTAIVKEGETINSMKVQFMYLYVLIACVCVVSFVLTFICK